MVYGGFWNHGNIYSFLFIYLFVHGKIYIGWLSTNVNFMQISVRGTVNNIIEFSLNIAK